MEVGELIKELQKYDPILNVYIETDDGHHSIPCIGVCDCDINIDACITLCKNKCECMDEH